jgi:hypothetical protein
MKPRQRNLPAPVRRAALDRDGHACVDCGIAESFSTKDGRSSLHVHHIVEFVNGGTHDLSNLASLCPRCHRRRDQKHCAKLSRQKRRMKVARARRRGFITYEAARRLLKVSPAEIKALVGQKHLHAYYNVLDKTLKLVSRAEVLSLKVRERAA